MSKSMAVIWMILKELGEPVHRTRLVKLTYLADNLFYEHFGKTITGLCYMWDDYGPNAISNAIVKEAEKLVNQDYACMNVGTSIYGSESYIYKVGPKEMKIDDELLSQLERHVISDVVKRYRGYNISQIIAASKKTEPFKKAHQYEVLKMNQSSEYLRIKEAIENNTELMAEIQEAIRAGAESEGIPLQEVKQKYGL